MPAAYGARCHNGRAYACGIRRVWRAAIAYAARRCRASSNGVARYPGVSEHPGVAGATKREALTGFYYSFWRNEKIFFARFGHFGAMRKFFLPTLAILAQ